MATAIPTDKNQPNKQTNKQEQKKNKYIVFPILQTLLQLLIFSCLQELHQPQVKCVFSGCSVEAANA